MNTAGWGSSDKEGDTATSVPEGFESKTGRGPSYQEIIGMSGMNIRSGGGGRIIDFSATVVAGR